MNLYISHHTAPAGVSNTPVEGNYLVNKNTKFNSCIDFIQRRIIKVAKSTMRT